MYLHSLSQSTPYHKTTRQQHQSHAANRRRPHCIGAIAQVALAEAHEHLAIIVDGVRTSILRVGWSTLDAHPLGGHVVVWNS